MWENPAMRTSPRIVFAAIFVACLALVGTAIFYFQEQLGLEPCPMCILQRYAFLAVGFVALVAAIHAPYGATLKAYAVVIALLAAAGAGVAIRHSYLQHFPPLRETCGTDLDFLLNTFSIAEAFPKIFAGTGSCSKVDWRFLGLSIPEWALVWFVLFALMALWSAFTARPRSRFR
jgi:disulfide bond formation protein DsbB